MQNECETEKSFTPRNADYCIWFGSPNTPKNAPIEQSLQRGVCYSLHKQRRWRMFDEMIQFKESREPHRFKRTSLDDIDAIQMQHFIRCAIGATQLDRVTFRRHVRCWVNTDTTTQDSVDETELTGLKTTDERKGSSVKKISCAKRKHHHRPMRLRCKSTSDLRDDLSLHETPASFILFKQSNKKKRKDCYSYRWDPRSKTNQNALKQYVHELNKGGAMDLLHQVYPTYDSDVEEETETVCRVDSTKNDQSIVEDYQAKSVHGSLDTRCGKADTKSDSEREMTDLVILDADSPELNANVFLDKRNRVLFNPVSVLLDDIDFERDVQSQIQTISITMEDSVLCLSVWSSLGQPHAYAIDLSPLITKDKSGDIRNSKVESTFQNVAYLLLREQQSELKELPTCKQFSAQLQIAMAHDCTRLQQSFFNLPFAHWSNAIPLDKLIGQAAEAVNRISNSAINWIACQPYENYKLVDSIEEPCSSVVNPDEAHVDPCDDTLKPTRAVSERTEVKTIQETRGRICVLCNHRNLDDPIELCVNQHYACLSCLRSHVGVKLNAVCCGVTESEVCWMCPQSGCPAPLSRLAQLQAAPLQRLAPVWKCADFLNEQLDHGSSRRPVFYANPQCNPQAVLTVYSGTLWRTPSRTTDINFQPSQDVTWCWPRLYFYPKSPREIHWPASCLAAKKYWRLREHLGDLQCICATTSPDTNSMKPVRLPKPDGERGRFYCDALKIAWRRNIIRKRYCTGKQLSSEFTLVDKERWRTIKDETIHSWFETLFEMQTVLEYLLVQIEFDSAGMDYQHLLNSMQHLELTLGQLLGVYPLTIIPTGTGPKRKQKKEQAKPYKIVPRKVIEKRIASFEQLKPRLSGFHSTS